MFVCLVLWCKISSLFVSEMASAGQKAEGSKRSISCEKRTTGNVVDDCTLFISSVAGDARIIRCRWCIFKGYWTICASLDAWWEYQAFPTRVNVACSPSLTCSHPFLNRGVGTKFRSGGIHSSGRFNERTDPFSVLEAFSYFICFINLSLLLPPPVLIVLLVPFVY